MSNGITKDEAHNTQEVFDFVQGHAFVLIDIFTTKCVREHKNQKEGPQMASSAALGQLVCKEVLRQGFREADTFHPVLHFTCVPVLKLHSFTQTSSFLSPPLVSSSGTPEEECYKSLRLAERRPATTHTDG